MRTSSVAALLGCCWLATCAAAHAAQSDFDQLMSALSQRKHGHVTFVEKKFLAMLERPVESSGELLYDAPDRLEKRTLKPKPETLVLQGDIVTAKRGHREYVLDLQQYPQVVPFIESIRATLAGDRTSLERVFAAQLEGDLAHWTLDLVPRDAKLAASIRKIVLAGEADQIHSIEIQEVDGDRSVLTIGAEVAQ